MSDFTPCGTGFTPELGIRRFCGFMVEQDLFGIVRLGRCWDRIGTAGQELVEISDRADA